MAGELLFAVDAQGRPVRIPCTRDAALVARERIGEVRCGFCRTDLVWAIGELNVPHFRHRPGILCTDGEDPLIADTETHRFVQRLLGEWCDRRGWEWAAEVTVEGENARTDFQTDFGSFTGRFEVQRSQLKARAWSDRTVAYMQGARFVQLLWEDIGIAAVLRASHDRPALIYRVNDWADGLELAGALRGMVRTEYAPLDEWGVTEQGLWHPMLDDIPRRSAESPVERAERYWAARGVGRRELEVIQRRWRMDR